MLKRLFASCCAVIMVSGCLMAGCSGSDRRESLQRKALDRVGELAGWKRVAPPKFRKLTADVDTFVDYLPVGSFAETKRDFCKSVSGGMLGGMPVVNSSCFALDEGVMNLRQRVSSTGTLATSVVLWCLFRSSLPERKDLACRSLRSVTAKARKAPELTAHRNSWQTRIGIAGYALAKPDELVW